MKDFQKKTRLATPEEESQNIDGFIDGIPVQIKASTYKTKNLHDNIQVEIIYYEKKKTYTQFDIPDKLLEEVKQKKLI